MPLRAGMAIDVQYVVGPGTMASDMGNPGMDVLGTPTIFLWVEDAANRLLAARIAV